MAFAQIFPSDATASINALGTRISVSTMAFHCPACDSNGVLLITRSLELPSDSRSDEITLQLVRCRNCAFEAVAVYEESRRGSLSGESVDHRGYHINRPELKELRALMAQCPHPRSTVCRCPAHRRLATTDKSGRWNGLVPFAPGEWFPMQTQ